MVLQRRLVAKLRGRPSVSLGGSTSDVCRSTCSNVSAIRSAASCVATRSMLAWSCVAASSAVGLDAARLARLDGAGWLVGLLLALACWLACVVEAVEAGEVGADLPWSRCRVLGCGGWLGLAELGFRRSTALRLCRLLATGCHLPPPSGAAPSGASSAPLGVLSASVSLELSGSTTSMRGGCRWLPLGLAALCRSSPPPCGAAEALCSGAASCRAGLEFGGCSAAVGVCGRCCVSRRRRCCSHRCRRCHHHGGRSRCCCLLRIYFYTIGLVDCCCCGALLPGLLLCCGLALLGWV